MDERKFIFLRNEFSILGIKYSNDPESLADKITEQENGLFELAYPKNGEHTEFHKINAGLQRDRLLRYYKKKLELIQSTITRLESEKNSTIGS